MAQTGIFHALCLHLHQPAGNLAALVGGQGEGRRVLSCYERIAEHAHKYAGVARFNLALSVPLLEQLLDPAVVEAWRPDVDLPSLVDALRRAGNIEFLGSGLVHTAFSAIPTAQWAVQLAAERQLMEDVLGRVARGFRAPDDDVPPGLVPALVAAGYEYLIVPAGRLASRDGGAPVDPFTPCRLVTPVGTILAVPVDGALSAAQFHGLDVAWFADEVKARTGGRSTALVTTLSDGENGENFRSAEGFFGSFLPPYLEFCETGEYPVRPVLLSEALAGATPSCEAVLTDWPAPSAMELPVPAAVPEPTVLSPTAPKPQRRKAVKVS